MTTTATPTEARVSPGPGVKAKASRTTTAVSRPAPQIDALPARLDVHFLQDLQHLCVEGIAKDLVIDASAVQFVDAAGLEFLENLDTVRRTAGATVSYLHPSPALIATFDLHGSKLAQAELIFS